MSGKPQNERHEAAENIEMNAFEEAAKWQKKNPKTSMCGEPAMFIV